MPAHDPPPRPAARSEPVPPLRKSSRSRQRVVVSLSSLAKAAPAPREEALLVPPKGRTPPLPAAVAAEHTPAPASSLFMEEEEPSFEAAPFGWKELQPGELPPTEVADGEVFQNEAPPAAASAEKTDLVATAKLPALATERNAAPPDPSAAPLVRPGPISATGSGSRELPPIQAPSAITPASPLPPLAQRRPDPSVYTHAPATPNIPIQQKDGGGEAVPEAPQSEKTERRSIGSLFAQFLKPYVPRKAPKIRGPHAALPPLSEVPPDEAKFPAPASGQLVPESKVIPLAPPAAAALDKAVPLAPPLQLAQAKAIPSVREETAPPRSAYAPPPQPALPIGERIAPLALPPQNPAPLPPILPQFAPVPASSIAPLASASPAIAAPAEVAEMPEPLEIGPPKSKVPPEHPASAEVIKPATPVSAPPFTPLIAPVQNVPAPAVADSAVPASSALGTTISAPPLPPPARPRATPDPKPRPQAIFSPPPADCISAAPVLSRLPPLVPLAPLHASPVPPLGAGAARVPPPLLAAVVIPRSLAPLPIVSLPVSPASSLVAPVKPTAILMPLPLAETELVVPPPRRVTPPDDSASPEPSAALVHSLPSALPSKSGSPLEPRPIDEPAPLASAPISAEPTATEVVILMAPTFASPNEPVLGPATLALPPIELLPMPSSLVPRPILEARPVGIPASGPIPPSRAGTSTPVVEISPAPIIEVRPKPIPDSTPAPAALSAASTPVVEISPAPIIDVRPAPVPHSVLTTPARSATSVPAVALLPLPDFRALNAPVRAKPAATTPPPLPTVMPSANQPLNTPVHIAPMPPVAAARTTAPVVPPALPIALPNSIAPRSVNPPSLELRPGSHPIVRSSPPLDIEPRVTPPPLPPPLPVARAQPRLIQARSFNTGQRPGLPAPVRISVSIPIVPPLAQTPVSALHVPPRKKRRQVLADRLAAVLRAPKRLTAKKPATRLLPVPGQPAAAARASFPPIAPNAPDQLAAARAGRQRKRRLVSLIFFYTLLVAVLLVLGFGGLYYGLETRVEGQIIPPEGMTLSKDAMIVTDLRVDVAGVVDDFAKERLSKMPNIEFDNQHVQRAQADIAQREDRIRLLQAQVQSSKDEITTTIKQARDQAQAIWDGPGTELDNSYNSRLDQLEKTIRDRAAALKLKYAPDETYRSPEVWANAYRLALYEVPPGVDSTKEHDWLEAQMTGWRNFVKQLDVRKQELREQATQIQMSPTNKLADINTQIDGLLHQIASTQAEEVPIQSELQQAQADLATAQSDLAALQPVYLKQLSALPDAHASEHLAVHANGRFSVLDFKNAFLGDETSRHFWILTRAYRADHIEYWSLNEFTVRKNVSTLLFIEPGSFVSTKVLLRPDLPASEAAL